MLAEVLQAQNDDETHQSNSTRVLNSSTSTYSNSKVYLFKFIHFISLSNDVDVFLYLFIHPEVKKHHQCKIIIILILNSITSR